MPVTTRSQSNNTNDYQANNINYYLAEMESIILNNIIKNLIENPSTESNASLINFIDKVITEINGMKTLRDKYTRAINLCIDIRRHIINESINNYKSINGSDEEYRISDCKRRDLISVIESETNIIYRSEPRITIEGKLFRAMQILDILKKKLSKEENTNTNKNFNIDEPINPKEISYSFQCSNPYCDSCLKKRGQFISDIKDGLAAVDKVFGKQNKVNEVIKIFTIIKSDFPKLIEDDTSTWIKFALVVYNKACELEDEYNAGEYLCCKQESINKLMQLLNEMKMLCCKYLEDISYDYKFEKGNISASFEMLEKARQRINDEKNTSVRKLRNVKKVNYSYMDMPTVIHAKDIAENIDNYNWGTSYYNYCNIALKQLRYENLDPDYVYEEDFDDDEL